MISAENLWSLVQKARWFGGRDREGKLSEIRALPSRGDVISLLAEISYPDAVETYHIPVIASALPKLHEAVDFPLALWEAVGPAKVARPTAGNRFLGEQSNTNVLFDNGILLKVLRRVEAGGGIEAELLAALQGSGVAPELYGSWSEGDLALGIFVEQLPDPYDGFDLATAAAQDRTDFSGPAYELGQALRQVHEQLRFRLSSGEIPADKLAKDFFARFSAAAEEVSELAALSAKAEAAFAAIKGDPISVQRVHGDCHLGQVLQSKARWCFVDFEGEPMKTLEQRRQLDSPLRDVAGMLRSFDYAAGRDNENWLGNCRRAFLAGYGIAEDALLLAYELDKACYETIYESRFRPELRYLPLGAVQDLLRRFSSD